MGDWLSYLDVAGNIVIMNMYYRTYLKLEIGKFWWEIGTMLPAVLLPCGLGFLLLQWLSADQLSGFVANVVFYAAAYSLSMYLLGMNHEEQLLIFEPLKHLTAKLRSTKEL